MINETSSRLPIGLLTIYSSPGRFFAVNELKVLLAHIVLNYDVKMSEDTVEFPDPIFVATTFLPNKKAKVLFRRRKT